MTRKQHNDEMDQLVEALKRDGWKVGTDRTRADEFDFGLIKGRDLLAVHPDETIGEWRERTNQKLSDFSVEEVSNIISVPLDNHCIDCGFDTHPGFDGRASVEATREGRDYPIVYEPGVNEVYAVKQEVWDASGVDSHGGCLCIGCLEKRIGRKLKPSDFSADNGLNMLPPHVYTPRLLSRRFNRQQRRAMMKLLVM
jgi:hypothetical protein